MLTRAAYEEIDNVEIDCCSGCLQFCGLVVRIPAVTRNALLPLNEPFKATALYRHAEQAIRSQDVCHFPKRVQ